MIEGLENMKSRLDDNASIYNKEDKRPAKQKFKELSGPEKWQFFKDYMLIKVIGGAVGLGLLIWFCISVFGPKPKDMLWVAAVNTAFDSVAVDLMTADVEERLDLDKDKKERVFIDANFNLITDEYNSRVKLVTMIAAGEIDCLIVPADEAQVEVNGGVIEELFSSKLSAQTLKDIEDYIVYMTPVVEAENGDITVQPEAAYGIDVTDAVTALSGYDLRNRYYLLIVGNAPHPENIEALVRYCVGL